MLRASKWPERHDCALLTSEGYATRAARDPIDLLGDSGQAIRFYCIHDADAYGTRIFEALQDATKARPARRVEIINLGLEPWEALEMGLRVEPAERSKDGPRKPTGQYVDAEWSAWLQTQGVELNAMTTPQFIEWLDSKMSEHGQRKLLPPAKVMEEELRFRARERLRDQILNEILDEAEYEQRVKGEFNRRQRALRSTSRGIRSRVARELEKAPDCSWRNPIRKFAGAAVGELS